MAPHDALPLSNSGIGFKRTEKITHHTHTKFQKTIKILTTLEVIIK
jgi:hypothetical protein